MATRFRPWVFWVANLRWLRRFFFEEYAESKQYHASVHFFDLERIKRNDEKFMNSIKKQPS